jgi:hypothetical protein
VLSTPVRRSRREHATVEGIGALEHALRLLSVAFVVLGIALVAARLR